MIVKYITILLLVISHAASGQFKTGTYYFVYKDTTISKNSIASLLQGQRIFSELELLPDTTFIYKYRTSTSCFLWYDSKGEWRIDKDRIILTDYVLGSQGSRAGDTTLTMQMIFRKTVFNIRNDSLFYSEQTYDRFKPGYYPLRQLFGNYAYKE